MTDSSTPAFAFDRIDRRTKKVTPALIAAVTERIVSSLHPLQVILFGSQAQDRGSRGSDIDLLIGLDDNHPLARLRMNERADKVLNLFRYRSFGLDVFVLTQGEIQHLRNTNEGEWDLVLEILEQGKVLYERRDAIQAK
jgi:predicted nucleotidyltransferase